MNIYLSFFLVVFSPHQVNKKYIIAKRDLMKYFVLNKCIIPIGIFNDLFFWNKKTKVAV